MSDPLRDAEAQSAGEPSPEVQFWTKEIDLARKREKKFRKEAEEVIKIYEAEVKAANSFNILYANTETLMPACYNQLPRAIADRRFKDADPLGKAGAAVIERSLTYLLSSPNPEYESFDSLFKAATHGALVPGRAVTWFRYDPEFDEKEPAIPRKGDASDVAKQEELTGDLYAKPAKVLWETVCGEDVNYDQFLHGYARRWAQVPWIAREHFMSEEDAKENFGDAVAAKMTFAAPKPSETQRRDEGNDEENNHGSVKVACVYEIWWKQKRQVVFFHPELKDKLCLTLEDPLKLQGFYPCPEPLRFYLKRSKLTPTPIYKVYESQAKELNKITMRIARVCNALKVRGFYDGTIQGLDELLNKDDNTLISAKNVTQFLQDGKSLQNAIWLMPLDELIKVLVQLYTAQANCKQTIYEITGVADIMRGDTEASETATAQNIKNKWGTLRLQQMQGAVQSYIRDCLRISAELVVEHFSVETLAAMTNLDYATAEQVAQATQQQQAIQAYLMQLQQQQPPAMPPGPGAQAGQPPAPPQQPQIPPQIQQGMQQVQQILSKPRWDDVLGLLKSDLKRSYRIDIETNSTLANTSGEDQQNITAAMTAISNMYESFLPAVQQGALTMPALKSMLLSVCRRFEFGRAVEQDIEQMPDQLPPPPPDPTVDAKLQEDRMQFQQEQMNHFMQMQQKDMDLQKREAAVGMKSQEVSNQIQTALKEIATTVKQAKMDQEQAQQKFEMNQEKRLYQFELNVQKALGKKQQMDMKAKGERDAALQQDELSRQKALGEHKLLNKEHEARESLAKASK